MTDHQPDPLARMLSMVGIVSALIVGSAVAYHVIQSAMLASVIVGGGLIVIAIVAIGSTLDRAARLREAKASQAQAQMVQAKLYTMLTQADRNRDGLLDASELRQLRADLDAPPSYTPNGMPGDGYIWRDNESPSR
jgi:cation transport ATPase